MLLAFIRVGTCLLLMVLCGCDPAWKTQFREGSKLYDKNGHNYFGKVVGYDAQHDFNNGTQPQAAILIEPAEGGADARVWGACATCAATFDVEVPR